jgi:hypothetical protein
VAPTASPHLPRHHPVIAGRSLGAGGERSEARDAAASTVVGACAAVGARVGRHRPARRGAIRLRSGCDRPPRKTAARAAEGERSTAPEGAMSLRFPKIPGPRGAIQPAASAFTERRTMDICNMYSMRRDEQFAVGIMPLTRRPKTQRKLLENTYMLCHFFDRGAPAPARAPACR